MFTFDTRETISTHAAESGVFTFDTRDAISTHTAESGVFTFDTRVLDGLGGAGVSGVFTFDTRSASGWNGAVEMVQFTPASVNAGQNIGLSFRVRTSTGTPATTARLLLSADAIINAGDAGLSPLDVAVPALGAGGVFNYSGTVTVPFGTPPGAYYVGVWADPNRVLNSITPANGTARSASRLTVTGTGAPALAVTPATITALAGGSVNTFTIRNAGGGSLSWSAAINNGVTWLHFISPTPSGVAGANGSSLIVSSDANPGTSLRSGSITITAPRATPALQTVTVTQPGKAAPAATVTSFVISPILSPQTVNAAFPLTITAMNGGAVQTAFNGQVALRAEGGGAPSLRYVSLVNGVWSGTVSVDAAGAQTVLVASTASAEGRSGAFAVSNPLAATQSFTVEVRTQTAPLPGATVTVQPVLNGMPPSIGTTDTKGLAQFQFSDVQLVTVLVTKAGFANNNSAVFAAAGGKHDVVMRSSMPPVIFVPGMMGSRSGTAYWGLVPTLPAANEPAKREALRLHNFADAVGWEGLRNRLAEDFEVFDAPWDWRVPVKGHPGETKLAWQIYLLPVIEKAKAETGSATVDIVAHSMGGSLVRAYIQSGEYANDIGKLAMVGPPQRRFCQSLLPLVWWGHTGSRWRPSLLGCGETEFDCESRIDFDSVRRNGGHSESFLRPHLGTALRADGKEKLEQSDIIGPKSVLSGEGEGVGGIVARL